MRKNTPIHSDLSKKKQLELTTKTTDLIFFYVLPI